MIKNYRFEYCPKSPTQAELYPAGKKVKPSLEKNYENKIQPYEVQKTLYPLPKPRPHTHRSITEQPAQPQQLELTISNQELGLFLAAIYKEYPMRGNKQSASFSYVELLEKFQNYRTVIGDKPLFDKFNELKIMRLLQKLYHTGILIADSQNARTYKIDYNQTKNLYINPKVF